MVELAGLGLDWCVLGEWGVWGEGSSARMVSGGVEGGFMLLGSMVSRVMCNKMLKREIRMKNSMLQWGP